MIATFAAGCFWHVQEVFNQIRGVTKTCVGYSGGTVPHPTYEQVCSHTTGHTESVQVTFDPQLVSFETLVRHFFALHDCSLTTPEQYRSIIFYHSPEQEEVAKKVAQEEAKKHPVLTQIIPAKPFFVAEDYHQHYLKKCLRS